MSAPGMAREARRRRVALGLSQTRVAGSLGVPATQIGRWERGEAVPTPAQLRSLARLLGMEPGELDSWLDEIALQSTGRPVSVELVTSSDGSERGAPADPWDLPPHKRIEPPLLDRDALIGRRGGRSDGSPPEGGTPSEWVLRRRAKRDERRARRALVAARRRARRQRAQAARRIVEEEARQVRTGPLPMAVPGELAARVAAPAGAANTGSVFPIPDTRRSSETVTYHSVEAGRADERLTYATRVVMTVVVLVALAGLLWWALGAFGDGIGGVLDLFRDGGGDTEPAIGALRLRDWG